MTSTLSPIRTVERFTRPIAVPSALRSWFSAADSIADHPELTEPFIHVPEVTTRLVLRDSADGRRDVLVIGPLTRATYKATAAPASCVRLGLAPGAAHALLGVPAADLTDRGVPLAELPGPLAEFADELTHAAPEEVSALLEAELPRRIPDTDTSQRALLHAATALLSATSATIPEVAARLAVSERHLRTLFTLGIGVSPKHFARIDRLRRTLSTAAHTPLARLAAEQGYYDQSHMTADFRVLMGVPPTSFFEGKLPAPTPCSVRLRD
ncbi:AraC family transcriptional regulator [Nocardia mexicana]|uniref:AraC family transcriptional regulator n=1 Tax=Nocardia mexicana TaxID=279262 RepID=UPI001B884B0C|nr:helix-turn-helix domain-containing protein [Nocardia mexicana]